MPQSPHARFEALLTDLEKEGADTTVIMAGIAQLAASAAGRDPEYQAAYLKGLSETLDFMAQAREGWANLNELRDKLKGLRGSA